MPAKCTSHALWWVLIGGIIAFGASPADGGQREDMFAAYRAGEAFRLQGAYPQAAAKYVQAIELAVRVFGDDALETAVLRNNFGMVCTELGRYDDAEKLYKQSLKVREARLGPDHVDVAQTLNNLGGLYRQTNREPQAISLFERSLKIREARFGPEHGDVAQSLNQLGSVYQDLGQFELAELRFQRALRICETTLGERHLETATSLNDLALLYAETGRPVKAALFYERSIRILESIYRPDHPLVAISLNNLASLYTDMGQFDKAEAFFERSLRISEVNFAAGHPSIARTINNLANVYFYKKEFAKAEALYKRSIQTQETTFGADSPQAALGLGNLATLYVEINRLDEAEPLLLRSNEIIETKLGAEHPDLALGLLNLANYYRHVGRYAEAGPLYERSLKIFQLKYGADHPRVAGTLGNFAAMLSREKQFTRAAEQFDQARRIVRRYNVSVLPALNEREQLTFLKNIDEANFHVALTFAWRHPHEPLLGQRAAGWLLNGKAVTVDSLAERTLLARDSANPAIAAVAQELASVRRELASLTFSSPGKVEDAARRDGLADLGRREQALSARLNKAVGRPVVADPWVEADAVRKSLPTDAALVEMVRLRPIYFDADSNQSRRDPPRYIAWIMLPAEKGDVKMVDLGTADEIDAAIQAACQGVQKFSTRLGELKADETPDELAEEQTLRPSLAALSTLVLQPLLKEIGAAEQLILSPDAALWMAPWAALPLADGRYLIEQYRVRFVTSGRRLVQDSAVDKLPTRPPIIMADPDFDLGPAERLSATRAVLRAAAPTGTVSSANRTASFSFGRVARLPGTAREAVAIAPKLARYAGTPPTTYADRFALETIFKALHQPKVLVMSTHGFFLPDQQVAVSDERRPGAKPSSSAVLSADGSPLENPLLRCGLLLAGCNRRDAATGGDDGVLTGIEIVGADLRGTELVVLSACETALGQINNGEGVAGVRQAFQLAGAQAVVATLWQIPDQETVDLMSGFFSNLADGLSKADALGNAQREQIEARRKKHHAAHPFFWAAFTITGQ